MSLEPWDELRTALHVARAGTVSGAAASLGVHHATVIRHIDALEDRLGVKLFQRHAKGYALTEAGQLMADEASATESRLDHLAARLQSLRSDIAGELVITTVPELGPILVPAVAELMRQFPALAPCLRTEARVLRLEYGEAHIAIRAGTRPQEPDNIVQPLGSLPVALYASKSYVATHGPVGTAPEDLQKHRFIGPEKTRARAPFDIWLYEAGLSIALRVDTPDTQMAAIRAGLGIGFVSPVDATADMVQVMPPRKDWAAPLWMVTHVDLHRAPKVQQTTALLKRFLAEHVLQAD